MEKKDKKVFETNSHTKFEENNNNNETLLEPQEEFAFGGSSMGSEMCSADEIFFQGQLLPLHPNPTLLSSRSARVSSGPRNRFHAHPSPKPQVPRSIERSLSSGRAKHKSSSTSMWDFFKVGLVRTPPDFEALESSKAVNYNSVRSKSNSSSNPVSRSSSGSNSDNFNKKNNKNKKTISSSGISMKLLSGCTCSVSDSVVVVHKTKIEEVLLLEKNSSDDYDNDYYYPKKQYLKEHERERRRRRRKQAESHHRTYEWLIKELSHANLHNSYNPPLHV